jgi:hypothetical protein
MKQSVGNSIWIKMPMGGHIELNYLIRAINEALHEKGGYALKRFSDIYEDCSHVHCEICSIVIADGNSTDSETGGYYSNDTWVCKPCYTTFVESNSYSEAVAGLERVTAPD